MSKTFHLRPDLKIKTFPIPPAGIDPLKVDEATILRHGFIPRPTWHPKLSALWERAATGIISFPEPRIHLREHGILGRHPVHPQDASPVFPTIPHTPFVATGADFKKKTTDPLLNWVTASWEVPTFSTHTGVTLSGPQSIAMGVSLNRSASSYLYAGVYYYWSGNETDSPTFTLFTEYAAVNSSAYCVAIDSTGPDGKNLIQSGTMIYLYLSVSTTPDNMSGVAHVLYRIGSHPYQGFQGGSQAGGTQNFVSLPSGGAPFTGATDAAWTVEDISGNIPQYTKFTFEGVSTGSSCPGSTHEPSQGDVLKEAGSQASVDQSGNVTCSGG
jgi:hypothetical protein